MSSIFYDHKKSKRGFNPLHIFSVRRRLPKKRRLYFDLIIGAILIIFIPLAVASLQSPKSAGAAWFDDSWGYRQRVDITNSSGSNQTDFQVAITLDTATLITAGKMRSTCNDIRVTDATGKPLPYWIETGTNACNTSTTAIWTKVPSITTGGATVFVYYGNPGATNIENGNIVFPFFDDFSGAFNTNKWNIVGTGGNVAQSAGVLTVTMTSGQDTNGLMSNGIIAKTYASGPGISVVTRSKTDASGGQNYPLFAGISTQTGHVHFAGSPEEGLSIYQNSSGGNGFIADGYGTVRGVTVANLTGFDSYHNYMISWIDTSTAKNYRDNSLQVTNSGATVVPDSALYPQLGGRGTSGAFVMSYDFIFTKKTASTEPTIGSPTNEEKAVGPIAWWKFDEGNGTAANDATTNGSNGTLTSGPTWQTEDQCISGKCIKFDGTNDYITYGTAGVLKSIGGSVGSTLNYWIKLTGTPSGGATYQVVGFGVGGGAAIDSKIDENRKVTIGGRSQTGDSFQSATSVSTLSLNTWYYITGVYDYPNDMIYIYINGLLDKSQSVTFGATSYTYAAPGVNELIGNFDGQSRFLNGFLDEPKIYGYARSASQIKADFNGRGGKAAGAALGASTTNQNISNGLIGYWKTDEASGLTKNCTAAPFVDASGNGNAGKSCPSTTGPDGGAVGKFGNAVTFDGSDDYIDFGSSMTADLTSFTIGYWWKGANSAAWAGPVQYRLSNKNGFQIVNDTNVTTAYTPHLIIWNGTAEAAHYKSTTVYNYPFAAFRHFVWTYNGTTPKLYVDGVEQTLTTSTVTSYALTGGFIGKGYAATGGSIDETRLYNRAISPAEVTQLYNFAPGPVAYYDFENGSGGSVTDKSGNANTGTWNGTGATKWKPGKYGTGGNLNGSDDYVSTTTNIIGGKSTVTLSAWVKPAVLTGVSGVTRVVSNFYTVLGYNSTGTPVFMIQTAVGAASLCTYSGITLSTNTWYHLTGIFDGSGSGNSGRAKMYINGIPLSQTSCDSTVPTTIYDSGTNIGIGADSGIAPNSTYPYTNGSIDEVKIYNYARTTQQIVQDMNGRDVSVGSPVASALLHYKLDDGFGNVASNSGSLTGITANLYNMANPATSTSGWSANGRYGKALAFDGSNDFVQVTGPNLADSVTMSVWMQPKTAFSNNEMIFDSQSSAGSNDNMYNIYLDSNGKVNTFYTGSCISNTALVLNTWTHVVVTGTTSQLKIYMNGVLDQTCNQTKPAGTTTVLRIGGRTASVNLFTGVLDEVKLYNYALTQDEIQRDMNQKSSQVLGAMGDNTNYAANAANQEYCVPGDSTSCTAPTARYDFEEGSGSTVPDTSGTGAAAKWNGTGTTRYKQGVNDVGWGGNFTAASSDYAITTAAVSTLFTNAAVTLEAWIKPTGTAISINTPYQGRAVVADDGAFIGIFRTNYSSTCAGGETGDKIYIYNWDGNSDCVGTTYAPDQWTHITFVHSGGTIFLYKNGVLAGSTASGNTQTMTGLLIMGRSHVSYNNFWQGQIDGVRVFNYARTQAQIAWDYNQGKPVGYWKMDECQGTTLNDSAGNGLTGTWTGSGGSQTSAGTCSTASTAWGNGATGKFNSSLKFDGTDDYVDAGDINALDSATRFTMAGWFKRNASSNPALVAKVTDTNNRVNVGFWNDGNIYFTVANAGLTYGQYALNDTNWHHLVMVYDGSQSGNSNVLKGYVDGVAVSLTYTGTIPSTTANHSGNFEIGRANVGPIYANGQIDDVRIYNYPLTATQVKNVMNQGGAVRFGPSIGTP